MRKKKFCNEIGAALVEYSLVVALVSVISYAGATTFLGSLQNKVVSASDTFDNAGKADGQNNCAFGSNQCNTPPPVPQFTQIPGG